MTQEYIPRPGAWQGGGEAARANEIDSLSLKARSLTLPRKRGRVRWGKPGRLRQLVEAFTEALEAQREADAFFRRLEDDEGRRLAVAQLPDQLVVHHHFGEASARQAAHEAGPAHVGLVDDETKAGRDQD